MHSRFSVGKLTMFGTIIKKIMSIQRNQNILSTALDRFKSVHIYWISVNPVGQKQCMVNSVNCGYRYIIQMCSYTSPLCYKPKHARYILVCNFLMSH